MSRALPFLALLVMACAPVNVADRPSPDGVAAILTVQNDRPSDATIYVVHNGATVRRVGVVTGGTEAHFALRHSDLSIDNTLQLRARFLAETPEVTSPVVLVAPGSHVTWPLDAMRTGEFLHTAALR